MHSAIKLGEFTYGDYLRWPEGERWELLDGHAHALAPPSTAHQTVVFELGGQLRNALLWNVCCGAVAWLACKSWLCFRAKVPASELASLLTLGRR